MPPRPLFLSLLEDYAPHWRHEHGVRELLQNWFDEAVRQAGGRESVSLHMLEHSESVHCELRDQYGRRLAKLLHQEGTLTLVNDNATIPRSALQMGGPGKRMLKETAGGFGEGLKTGICALLRTGCTVLISSGRGEAWRFGFAVDANFGGNVRSLCAELLPDHNTSSVRVKVCALPPEGFLRVQHKFLFLKPPAASETYRSAKGDRILLGEQHRGLLFVKDIQVMQEKELSFGFNAVEAQLGRDRDRLQMEEYAPRYMDAWSEALEDGCTQPMRDAFWKAVQVDKTVEARSLDLLTVEAAAAVAAIFHQKHRNRDTVIVSATAASAYYDARLIQSMGYSVCRLNSALYQLLAEVPSVLTLDRVLAQRMSLLAKSTRVAERAGEQEAMRVLFREAVSLLPCFNGHEMTVHFVRLPKKLTWMKHVIPPFAAGQTNRIVLIRNEDYADQRFCPAVIDHYSAKKGINAHWMDGSGYLEDNLDPSEATLMPSGSERAADFRVGDQVLALWNADEDSWYQSTVSKVGGGKIDVVFRSDGSCHRGFAPWQLARIGARGAGETGYHVYINMGTFNSERSHAEQGGCHRKEQDPCLCHFYDVATALLWEGPQDRGVEMGFYARINALLSSTCRDIVLAAQAGGGEEEEEEAPNLALPLMSVRKSEALTKPCPPPAAWPAGVAFCSNLVLTDVKDAMQITKNQKMKGVRISRCPKAHPCEGEYGVFAESDFTAGHVFGAYAGKVLKSKKVPEAADLTYAIDLGEHHAIDARECGNEARFVNDYTGIAVTPNAEFVLEEQMHTGQHVIVLRALARIKAGSELLVDYGARYWKGKEKEAPKKRKRHGLQDISNTRRMQGTGEGLDSGSADTFSVADCDLLWSPVSYRDIPDSPSQLW